MRILFILMIIMYPCTLLANINQTIVTKAEKYFNDMTTLECDIEQINPDRSTANGRLALQRKNGTFQLQYDDQDAPQISCDSQNIIIRYQNAGDTNYIPAEEMPVYAILSKHVNFSKDATVLSTHEDNKYASITLVKKNDPNNGKITFKFVKPGFKLIGWEVVDQEGKKTIVKLSNIAVH